MTNTPAQITSGEPVKPFEKFKNDLVAQKSKLEKVLPAHISFEKFHSVVMTACMTNHALITADRSSMMLSCVKAATDGLLPDQREAALVIFNAKLGYKDDSGRDVYGQKVQYMPMFAGLLKKARQSEQISSIATHVVYAKDRFKYVLGDEDTIIHEPYMGEEERGPLIAAYCIAKLKDGSVYREVMTRADIEKVRKTSKSGNDKSGNPQGIWKDWYEEMARKTVFRRAAKWLPQSVDKSGKEIRLFENDDTMDTFDAPVDAAYTKEDEELEDEIQQQIEHRQEVPQPDLKQAIAEKKKAEAPSNKVEKEEPKAERKRSAFDMEQEIRKAITAAKNYDEAYDLVTNDYADDLAHIEAEAKGSYATLKTWIDAQMKTKEGGPE